ncbi:MAG: hypothetical protein AAFV53_26285 [Myxococcota bacterium]
MSEIAYSQAAALAEPNKFDVIAINLDSEPFDERILALPKIRRLVLEGETPPPPPDWLLAMPALTSVYVKAKYPTLPAVLLRLPHLKAMEIHHPAIRALPQDAEEIEINKLVIVEPPAKLLSQLRRFRHIHQLFLTRLKKTLPTHFTANVTKLVVAASRLPGRLTIPSLRILELRKIDRFPMVLLDLPIESLKVEVDGRRIPAEICSMSALRKLQIFLPPYRATQLPEDIGQLKDLEVLELGGQIDQVPLSFGELQRLKRLRLRLKDSTGIDVVLPRLRALQSLELTLYDMREIDLSEALGVLQDLEELKLWARPNRFPHGIGRLTRLKKLKLDLSPCPEPFLDDVRNLHGLEELSFTLPQEATEFPPGVLRLTNLTRLKVDGSSSAPMPPEFGNLRKLQVLETHQWYFGSLPETFYELTELEDLKMWRAELPALSEKIGQLKKLRKLDLFDNKLTGLPERIGELEALEELHLRKNPLETLPESIGQLKRLTVWRLDETALTTLPERIGELSSLRELHLDQTQTLITLPDTIGNLNRLESLWLQDTGLRQLPESMQKMERLRYINASRTKLSDVPNALLTLPSLRELDLTGTVFEQAAYDRLSVRKHPECQILMPRLQKTIPIPDAPDPTPLASAVWDAVAVLGGTVAPHRRQSPWYETLPFGRFPVPEAIRAFCQEVHWPEKARFAGQTDGWDHRMLWFNDSGAPGEEYEVAHNHPLFVFAEGDGGNLMYLFRMDDRNLADPGVYRLSHDDTSASALTRICPRLSVFLASLAPEN